MDSNIILGIVITVVVVIPVLFLATSGKRKQKKSICRFKDFASSHSLQLSECDCCERLLIGIDNASKKLVYKQGGEEANIIDLNDIKNCANKTSSEIINGEYIDKLEMDLIFKDGRGTKTLTFFTSENKLTIEDEKNVMEQWHSRIASLIG